MSFNNTNLTKFVSFHDVSIAFKFFPFVSFRMKILNKIPYKQTPAQIHATPYKCTFSINIGNVFSEMNANILFDSMHSIDPTLRTCFIVLPQKKKFKKSFGIKKREFAKTLINQRKKRNWNKVNLPQLEEFQPKR